MNLCNSQPKINGKIDFPATGNIDYTRIGDKMSLTKVRKEINKTEKKPFIKPLKSNWYYRIICPECQCRLRHDDNWIFCSRPNCNYFESKILLDEIVLKFYKNIRVISGENGITSPGTFKFSW